MTADALLVETVERLLADVSTFEEVERAEGEGWSATTWAALADAGFAWVGIDEDCGGSGGTAFDLAALLRAVGRFSAPVPLAETAAIGARLLADAGLVIPTGPVTAVESPGRIEHGRLRAAGVAAFARHADRIVVAVGDEVYAIDRGQAGIRPGTNLAGEARDLVEIDVPVAATDHASIGEDAWRSASRRGALSRVVMSAGALGATSQMTIDYANARRQFGKPVATFQAVQQHLVVAAQSAVKVRMAADIAVRAAAAGDGGFEIAAARVVLDEAVSAGTRAAHQAHGAMGVTREYPLHHLTRRLWSWRHEWGTSRSWRHDAARQAIAVGADRLFTSVTH